MMRDQHGRKVQKQTFPEICGMLAPRQARLMIHNRTDSTSVRAVAHLTGNLITCNFSEIPELTTVVRIFLEA